MDNGKEGSGKGEYTGPDQAEEFGGGKGTYEDGGQGEGLDKPEWDPNEDGKAFGGGKGGDGSGGKQ